MLKTILLATSLAVLDVTAVVDAALAQRREFRVPDGRTSRAIYDDGIPRRSLGGGRLVCVRTCDGFFFPLSNAPDGRSGADKMCQALCPGAETVAYAMPSGEDTELDSAMSLKGKPYTRLAAAFKFQKSVDLSCSCKKDGQTWAQVLTRAEKMLGRQRGDIIVTARKAEKLSRPKIALAKRSRDKNLKLGKPLNVETTGSVLASAQAAAAKASEMPESRTNAEDVASIPTASRASAGIGPKSIEGAKVLDQTDGPKHELTDDQGGKRTVRIIAPTIISVPAQVQASPP